MGSIKDPLKGWVDNFNGPVGLCTAYAKGIYKVGLIDSNLHNDQIPVDIVIKTFIVMAWKRGAKMTYELIFHSFLISYIYRVVREPLGFP